jgi:hypothetical protein
MYGQYLNFTSALALAGWLIVALTTIAVAGLFVQRDRPSRPITPRIDRTALRHKKAA